MKIIYLSIFLIGTNLYAQDTIVYKGILRNTFLIETIELYSDSTFKWTNEYDLSWSEYGKYKIAENKLILDHYIFSVYPETMSLKDSIATLEKPTQTRILEIENNRIYPMSDKGKRITKMKDPYFRRKWGWLFGNRFEYKITREK
ncbi:hypothetical protein INR76_06035 [Marixanthomonas sp. SCSIO 43207]|uniref:hypothetical protein n=1 Tax=Marixanthomonas sp. SCSIO 43207 TaxID=2779360 RepID=UPI001CA81925|nr:hypothetical protein [Marixanthomonas sp. SCSIO 43207]UAB82317.1 hypothetical protein INR76_06035 [Marixanthomonas sp. SCSIO 43207]